ncbi:uncharacterized protein BJX67DRAFT_237899 [Aspergillus lucknowensis]|uniref:Uncharacterized protein n=1 Tax=Aspergillus lucknowensis TaxID=176173 RepID=A0ABR4LGT1_9EURO
MLDVRRIDAVILPLVVDVHLPKLEHAGDIFLVESSTGEVDLGSLVDADNIYIQGDWSSINLGSLNTVTQQLELHGWKSGEKLPEEAPFEIVVDLPVLKSANHLTVAGFVKSVSLPRLTVVGEHEEGIAYLYQSTYPSPELVYLLGRPGLRISIASHIEVEIPELHSLDGTLEVYGNVSSIRLPSLGKTDLGITFTTDAYVSIFSTIESARHFYLWGNVGSVDLPDLVDVGTMSIAYRRRLPCNETLVKLWSWIPENDGSQYRCFEVDDSEANDDDEDTSLENPGTPGSDDGEDTETDDQTTDPEVDTENNDNNRPEPGADDEMNTNHASGNTDNDPSQGVHGYNILPHTGFATLCTAVIIFCCY